MEAVQFPENVATDKHTISFQGRLEYKGHNKHKRAGDGFQCDSIACEGYPYTCYFRYQPAPEKYLKQGLPPLHARVLFLFDHLKFKSHSVWMDNLNMSLMFCKTLINSLN